MLVAGQSGTHLDALGSIPNGAHTKRVWQAATHDI